ncbi:MULTISPECIES: HlyD family efflux transporter periplasmic adaptor subunit [unclassified Pseudoalteromonas]|uniref:HlyD family secretion protein n=1 Tax=unclassified Pseudoalteromonas TaxID=194690 RepID=UPI0020972BDC|nr:HlyD family efflux transporter periplasmic adaptor subunit [Pseudoalteromonas sp. XMcav2-N]MCO7191205.1 HlyD family efflux transporter periplasmic adaptor subunit [Pseudoalteromonas sp. XMcav2-N]
MDIQVEQKNNIKVNWLWLGGIALVIIVTGWMVAQPAAQASLPAENAWIGTVTQGDLTISVAGFGQLKSRTPRLVSAASEATVEEILLRPGTEVTPSSVIMKLKDASLSQSLKDAKRALQQAKDQYLQSDINQQREMLSHQASLEILKSELESAELEVSAQAGLVEDGAVSKLDYQRTVLEHRQLKRRIDIEQRRIAQLKTLHQANLQLANSDIEAAEEAYQLIQHRVDQLTVRAGITGVVQQLHVELGQSVPLGAQLVLVGSTKDLYAQLQIPQAYAEQIKLEQSVQVNTRADFIAGTVSRINPMVQNGNIEVEVALPAELPDSARPELNIEGTIHISTLKDALYIDKPVGAKAFSTATLYRIEPNTQQAHAIEVHYGAQTAQYIQLLSGAQPEQRFILSDMASYRDEPVVYLSK